MGDKKKKEQKKKKKEQKKKKKDKKKNKKAKKEERRKKKNKKKRREERRKANEAPPGCPKSIRKCPRGTKRVLSETSTPSSVAEFAPHIPTHTSTSTTDHDRYHPFQTPPGVVPDPTHSTSTIHHARYHPFQTPPDVVNYASSSKRRLLSSRVSSKDKSRFIGKIFGAVQKVVQSKPFGGILGGVAKGISGIFKPSSSSQASQQQTQGTSHEQSTSTEQPSRPTSGVGKIFGSILNGVSSAINSHSQASSAASTPPSATESAPYTPRQTSPSETQHVDYSSPIATESAPYPPRQTPPSETAHYMPRETSPSETAPSIPRETSPQGDGPSFTASIHRPVVCPRVYVCVPKPLRDKQKIRKACRNAKERLKEHPGATPGNIRRFPSDQYDFDEDLMKQFFEKCKLKLVQKVPNTFKKCGDTCTMNFCEPSDGMEEQHCKEETGYVQRNTKKCGMHKPKSCLPLADKCKQVFCMKPICKPGERFIKPNPDRGNCCGKCKKINPDSCKVMACRYIETCGEGLHLVPPNPEKGRCCAHCSEDDEENEDEYGEDEHESGENEDEYGEDEDAYGEDEQDEAQDIENTYACATTLCNLPICGKDAHVVSADASKGECCPYCKPNAEVDVETHESEEIKKTCEHLKTLMGEKTDATEEEIEKYLHGEGYSRAEITDIVQHCDKKDHEEDHDEDHDEDHEEHHEEDHDEDHDEDHEEHHDEDHDRNDDRDGDRDDGTGTNYKVVAGAIFCKTS